MCIASLTQSLSTIIIIAKEIATSHQDIAPRPREGHVRMQTQCHPRLSQTHRRYTMSARSKHERSHHTDDSSSEAGPDLGTSAWELRRSGAAGLRSLEGDRGGWFRFRLIGSNGPGES